MVNLIHFKKSVKIFTDLKFAIAILLIIAIASSFGSFIEQEENIEFYKENYPIEKPIYGIFSWKLITLVGLDHVYTTWWFLLLLITLGISLIGCTITRQFPLFSNSKEFFFRKKKQSFLTLPFSIKFKNIYYLKENLISKLQAMNFYIYQYGNLIYGFKGLIGRLSPILVHFSLIIILGGSSWGAFNNFKVQEILPKGEIFHIQNPIKIGLFTSLPEITTRINDFWVEYENNKIHQFYSNISILDNNGNEVKNQTISVNNPLRYKNVDFYQSDWNLLGIRVKNINTNKTYEIPLFTLRESSKSWITWINNSSKSTNTLIIENLQNTFSIYDEKGNFLKTLNIGDLIDSELQIIEILPSTGLQIKYDPSIPIIYFGFGLLMLTSCLSYLPYTQIWIYNDGKNCWIGCSTNRGKIQIEIEFENLIRHLEKITNKNYYRQ
jgi:cytochrome c biogenesis protein